MRQYAKFLLSFVVGATLVFLITQVFMLDLRRL